MSAMTGLARSRRRVATWQRASNRVCFIKVHRTGPRCASMHRFQGLAVFYPNLYPERRHSEAETLCLLIAGTSRSSPTEHAANLPSWSCGFDSRRPLRGSSPGQRLIRRSSGCVLPAACPLRARSGGARALLGVVEQLAHARGDGLVTLAGGVQVDERGPGAGVARCQICRRTAGAKDELRVSWPLSHQLTAIWWQYRTGRSGCARGVLPSVGQDLMARVTAGKNRLGGTGLAWVVSASSSRC